MLKNIYFKRNMAQLVHHGLRVNRRTNWATRDKAGGALKFLKSKTAFPRFPSAGAAEEADYSSRKKKPRLE